MVQFSDARATRVLAAFERRMADEEIRTAALGDGVPLDDFADAAVERMAAGDEGIGYGQSETFRKASPDEVRSIFAQLNA